MPRLLLNPLVRLVLPLLLATLIPAGPTWALAGPWSDTREASVRLIAATSGTGDLTRIPLGLDVRLADGWKTYWRNPGAAGLPPTLHWTQLDGVEAVTLDYPAPHRFTLWELDTFGYQDQVVYPLTAKRSAEHIARPEAPLALRAVADLLICDDALCIPRTFELSIKLPPGPATPSTHAQAIARATSQIPRAGTDVGVQLTSLTAHPAHLGLQLIAQTVLNPRDVVVEGPDGPATGAPSQIIAGTDGRVLLTLPRLESAAIGADGDPLLGAAVQVTVLGETLAVEAAMTVTAAGGDSDQATLWLWTGMLAAALAGGLILNVMPCVLPVLSLKILGVVQAGGTAPAYARLGFLAAAAGIIAMFVVLATAMVVLRLVGAQVGWGIQFQQPWFLTAMIVLLALFAANLLGGFEIAMPSWISRAAGAVGGSPGGRASLGSHFLTGALATILATPCSAPFVGTALGFALSRGPLEIVAIFIAMGFGLALPLLLLASVPQLLTRLPRPGPWMLAVKKVLASLLAVTALWLASILALIAGPLATGLVIAGTLALFALLLWWRRMGQLAPAAVLGAVALAASGPLLSGGSPAAVASTGDRADWRPLGTVDPVAEAAVGQVVLVDITAAWCVTCLVNKQLVLDTDPIQTLLEQQAVVTIRGDWTRPNAAVADYLATHGRYGIPFNAVYGPSAPNGVVLDEILTIDAVHTAIKAAGG
jgi:suppressor for copper-sensitivity B